MAQYLIEATVRHLVTGADSPERALAWFQDLDDTDVDVSPISFAQPRVLGNVADDVRPLQLEPSEFAQWRLEHVAPTSATAAGPVDSAFIRNVHAWRSQPTRGRGGYRPGSRVSGLLVDIKVEALSAKQTPSRSRRDRAFTEIAELAQRCVDLVDKFGAATPAASEGQEAHRAS